MRHKWLCTLFILLAIPARIAAQEPYLVAYAGFAGFQAPVWAPKDLGLFAKYGFNGDLVLVPGSVRQIQAIVGGSIHLAQADAATAVNAINQGRAPFLRRKKSRHGEAVPKRNPSVKVDLNVNRYLDESTVDELEREGFLRN